MSGSNRLPDPPPPPISPPPISPAIRELCNMYVDIKADERRKYENAAGGGEVVSVTLHGL